MRLGDVIDGKYRLDKLIGEGGMGRVFAATHAHIGTTIAVKVLKPQPQGMAEIAKRFMREARSAGRLRNEHVTRVFDAGVLPSGEPYMVMELLEGADLQSQLQQRPFSYHEAARFIIEACEGLAEAHACGMIHRDIKPANLFLTTTSAGKRFVKLLDFGIATAATGDDDHGLTQTHAVMGSPTYMSPEQLRSAKDVDERSDIWSLGVSLYELVTGRVPFEGASFSGLSIKIATEPHAPMTGVPAAFARVVDTCLEKDRRNRYQSVADLAAALSPFALDGVDGAARVGRSLGQEVAATLHDTGGDLRRSEPPAAAMSPTPVPIVSPPSPAAARLASTTGSQSGEIVPTEFRVPRTGRLTMIVALLGSVAVAVAFVMIVMTGGSDAKPAKPKRAARPYTPDRPRPVLAEQRNPFLPVKGIRPVVQEHQIRVEEYQDYVARLPVHEQERAAPYGAQARAQEPVRWVSFAQATRFCEALGARLLTSEEWLAASGRSWGLDPAAVGLRGPLREWTSSTTNGLAIARGATASMTLAEKDQVVLRDEKIFKPVESSPGDPPEKVADETIGFRCAHD